MFRCHYKNKLRAILINNTLIDILINLFRGVIITDNYNLIEADDILDYFDIDQMNEVINDQIVNASDYSVCGVVIDYLKPLYAKFKSIEPDIEHGIDNDKMQECKEKFNIIVLLFTDAICTKFGIAIDTFWYDNASDDEKFLLALYLYSFFVIDFKTVVTDICINYIDKNKDDLGNMLASEKTQKSATYNSILNITGDSNLGYICSNIFDAIYYIFDTLNLDTIFDYTPEDYLPVEELKSKFVDGIIGGEIYERMLQCIKSNSTLSSAMAFDIISYIKTSYKIVTE